ncbi:hypothetical protein SAMN05216353_10246 [Halobacillus alkaliphilus]|uniref:Uncharacterized protein n=1 Tax=Halobacillus alkaliphilus TaxID=396056 RepID=A0A1I2JR26_9BACI|nr:hypothetical protein [Halobacillus alkaliphilus]SFF57252.1 hypothetical protein SAMN05216353_10246 [Halobacillus alkaliphilus]
MKENLKYAWIASWFALVGQLLFFIGVSFYTGEWRYVMWSLLVSIAAGVPSMIRTSHAQKQVEQSKKEGES